MTRLHRGIDPQRHVDGCRFKFAAVCAVAIECHHGYDVCPTCDPCTCDAIEADSDATGAKL